MTSYVVRKERCPECAKRGKDTRGDNLHVYSDEHKFCFSCHHFIPGNRIRTIMQHVRETTVPEDVVVFPDDVSNHPNETALTWFTSFGFDFSDVVRNGVLWSESFKRLIFPVYDENGELLAWQGRYFGQEDRPKWYTKGKIHEIVYTRGPPSDSIVLVEDVVSCWKIAKADIYTGCLFGSNPSKLMLNRFRLVADKLVFWLDDDKKVESAKFKRTCEMVGIPSSCIWTTSDPKEYSVAQIKEIVNGSV